MKIFYTTLLMLLLTTGITAQSTYIPNAWRQSTDGNGTVYTEGSNSYYKHTKSSTHFDVYYGTGYGTTPPEKLATSNSLYVDVDDLLEKAETFFALNVDKLKFADLSANSKLNRYKMIICLLHDTGWTATGSGYDNQVGALWVTPSTCHPIGHTIAHEIGHSFQYQCYSDLGGYAGFRYANGNGSGFWEQTAQWQAANAYPNQMISESIGVWRNSHNYAFTHEWQRYQSYWLHYYWADKHGIDAVARVWRGGTVNKEDPCQVYMRVFGVSEHDFFKEIYDYASRMATYDIDAIRTYGKNNIGDYTYKFYETADGMLQVAYASCPQSTGFNIIPLQVPEAGTEITTVFSALAPGRAELAEGDPAEYINGDSRYVSAGVTKYNAFTGTNYRGFRHGYVALLNDGTRIYQSVDTVYSVATTLAERYRAMNDTTSFVVPEGTQRLFFIVVPAPTKYIVHNWDENISNDDQWPYQLAFENTDIIGHIPHVDLSDTSILPSDTTLDIYVGFDASSTTYPGTTYSFTINELKAIGEALRVQPADISGLIRSYSASQANNTIQLMPVNPRTGTVLNSATTSSSADGTGHWFTSAGAVCSWGNTAYIYSELNTSTLTFTIGQYPGRCRDGQVYTIGQALRYKNENGKTGNAKIIFHIYIGGVPTSIDLPQKEGVVVKPTNIYDITGHRLQNADHLSPGLYIIGGKKILIK